jgi:hypothetical protein
MAASRAACGPTVVTRPSRAAISQNHGTRPTAHVQDLTVAGERVGHQGDVVALEPTLARSFAGARHLRSITPPPTLPYGVNMDFHLLLLT